METLEMVEEYNKEGVCIKRTINGHELKSVSDYWLAKITERDAMILAAVEARMLLSDFPRDEKTIDDVLSTLSEVMGRE